VVTSTKVAIVEGPDSGHYYWFFGIVSFSGNSLVCGFTQVRRFNKKFISNFSSNPVGGHCHYFCYYLYSKPCADTASLAIRQANLARRTTIGTSEDTTLTANLLMADLAYRHNSPPLCTSISLDLEVLFVQTLLRIRPLLLFIRPAEDDHLAGLPCRRRKKRGSIFVSSPGSYTEAI
jgi:hypothetical protein